MTDRDLIDALQDRFADLSDDFYTEYQKTKNRNMEIVEKYHAIYSTLRNLGWNGGIDVDCMLPKDLMPQEYMNNISRGEHCDPTI